MQPLPAGEPDDPRPVIGRHSRPDPLKWPATAGEPIKLQFEPVEAADARYPRELNLVVLDADTGRPVQALKLGC